MIKVVLFDIDGTLIRTGGAGVAAFKETFRQEFAIEDGTHNLPFAGRTDYAIVSEFFGRHGIEPSPVNFRRCFARYVHWLRHFLDQLDGRVLPGVERLLSELQTSSFSPKLGLLTGNIRLGAEIKLRHFDLWDYFAFGAFGDNQSDRNALAALGRQRAAQLFPGPLDPREIMVVGDTPHDIACGKSIGAHVLAVATGGSTLDALAKCQPTWAVPTLENTSVGHILSAKPVAD